MTAIISMHMNFKKKLMISYPFNQIYFNKPKKLLKHSKKSHVYDRHMYVKNCQ